MTQCLHLLQKALLVLIIIPVLLIIIPSCGKDAGVKPNDYFTIENSTIAVVDGSNGGTKLADALIFKTVAFSPDTPYTGGYAYSSVMKSNSGRLLIAATAHKSQFDDFFPGTICYKASDDNGKTWSNSQLMQENIGQLNVMQPSLMALPSGRMLCLFLVKNSRSNLNIMCKEGSDSGNAWLPAVNVGTPDEGYKITMNGRLFKTKAGRLILPVAFLRSIDESYDTQIIYCYISDDNGKTWRKTRSYGCNIAITEPGITELGDGTLLMCLRSPSGKVLFSKSRDGGESWDNILKSNIDVPESPQAIIYSDKHKALFMVWNDAIYDPAVFLNRSRLSLAVSHNNGQDWLKLGDLGNNSDSLFFYPNMVLDNDDLIVTYSKFKKNTFKPSVVFERLDINKLIN